MPPRKTTRKPATPAQGRSPLTPGTPVPPRADANGPDAPSSGLTHPASRTGAGTLEEPMEPTPDTGKKNNDFDGVEGPEEGGLVTNLNNDGEDCDPEDGRIIPDFVDFEDDDIPLAVDDALHEDDEEDAPKRARFSTGQTAE
ncbi:hypothetical protein FDECE_9766 [Fusarium decemcellulare]|nr:hypothetical protein FDECE_9766 [Fusarium decemcellulare]